MNKKYIGLKKVGSLIEGVTEPVFKSHGFANQKIITYWPQIVGETLAKFTIPQKINFPPGQSRAGILYIGVTNPGLGLEIQAQESRIVDKISTFFGYQAVGRIKISLVRFNTKTTTHKPAQKLDFTDQEKKGLEGVIDKVDDEELKKRLKALADTFF